MRILELHQQGFDHNYISQEVGMRPQNVLGWLRKNAPVVTDSAQSLDIVSPDKQREVLDEATEELTSDIKKLDNLIEFHYKRYKELASLETKTPEDITNAESSFAKLTKLISMKNLHINSIVQHWGIQESITKAAKTAPSALSATNMQVNFEHIMEQKLNPDKVGRITKEIKEVIDEKMFGESNGSNGKD